jgi:hypothetical protein
MMIIIQSAISKQAISLLDINIIFYDVTKKMISDVIAEDVEDVDISIVGYNPFLPVHKQHQMKAYSSDTLCI